MLEHCHTPSRQVDVLMPVDSLLILSCLWFDDGEALTFTFCVLVLVSTKLLILELRECLKHKVIIGAIQFLCASSC